MELSALWQKQIKGEQDVEAKEVFLVGSSAEELAVAMRSDAIDGIIKDFGTKITSILLTNGATGVSNGLWNFADFERAFRWQSFMYYSKSPRIEKGDYPYAVFCEDLSTLRETVDAWSSLRLFSNYSAKNTVAAKTTTFFDFYGLNGYCGGAERYLVDLDNILRETGRGVSLDIYQQSLVPFFRRFGAANVIGLGNLTSDDTGAPQLWTAESVNGNAARFEQMAGVRSQAYIYSSFYECQSADLRPALGISHGVFWDSPHTTEEQRKRVLDRARMCAEIVSVDTNTCNWLQTVDFNFAINNCTFVPNYVDTEEFYPRDGYLEPSDRIRIVFPRRLYAPRGLDLVLEVLDSVLEAHQNVEFHFVGRGEADDLARIDKFVSEYSGRVFRYEKMPDEMPEVYRMADISLIPTVYSEGTSLSCLEALSSGNLVIATRVGGLVDLVFNNYNGLLVDPRSEALLGALEYAIDNLPLMSRVRKKAVEVAEAFSKRRWKENWLRVLDGMGLGEGQNCDELELVEVILPSDFVPTEAACDLIRSELCKGALVYVKTSSLKESLRLQEEYGGNLLQFLPADTPSVAPVARTYILNQDGVMS